MRQVHGGRQLSTKILSQPLIAASRQSSARHRPPPFCNRDSHPPLQENEVAQHCPPKFRTLLPQLFERREPPGWSHIQARIISNPWRPLNKFIGQPPSHRGSKCQSLLPTFERIGSGLNETMDLTIQHFPSQWTMTHGNVTRFQSPFS